MDAPEVPARGHVFTACFILVQGGPDRDRILDEIRCHVEFHAEVNPLSRGPVLAVDIPCAGSLLSEETAAGSIAQALGNLPCGAILEWLVPLRDAARACGMYAAWGDVQTHPDLVELDRKYPGGRS